MGGRSNIYSVWLFIQSVQAGFLLGASTGLGFFCFLFFVFFVVLFFSIVFYWSFLS